MLSLIAIAGCVERIDTRTDAAPPRSDASPLDAANDDASETPIADAATPDTAFADAGAADASVPDAPPPDAGPLPVDASLSDGSNADAAAGDAVWMDAVWGDAAGAEAPGADAMASDATVGDAGAGDAAAGDAAAFDATSRDAAAGDATAFALAELTTALCTVVTPTVAGPPYRDAIAASGTKLFYAGNDVTAAFRLSDLRFGKAVANPLTFGNRYDALTSDLLSGRAYTFASGGRPIQTGAVTIEALLEIDPDTGTLLPVLPIYLSRTIPMRTRPNVPGGFFAGMGFVAIYDGYEAYRVDLPSGVVTSFGRMPPVLVTEVCASAFIFGVAETFGGALYLVTVDAVVRPASQIKRHRVPDGATSVVATFTDLGRMCGMTVVPAMGAWYFHHEGASQLSSGIHAIGRCDARFAQEVANPIPAPIGVVKSPIVNQPRPAADVRRPRLVATANSFVAPPGRTLPTALGTWLEQAVEGPVPLQLQVWDDAAGAPDPRRVLAATAPTTRATSGRTYVELPVIGTPQRLVPGRRYWFAAIIDSTATSGGYSFAEHATNSDGIEDDAVRRSTNDPALGSFSPSGRELAFQVLLDP